VHGKQKHANITGKGGPESSATMSRKKKAGLFEKDWGWELGTSSETCLKKYSRSQKEYTAHFQRKRRLELETETWERTAWSAMTVSVRWGKKSCPTAAFRTNNTKKLPRKENAGPWRQSCPGTYIRRQGEDPSSSCQARGGGMSQKKRSARG